MPLDAEQQRGPISRQASLWKLRVPCGRDAGLGERAAHSDLHAVRGLARRGAEGIG